MNERLRALMLQAGYAAPELAVRAQKLAELITQDCANIDFRHALGLSGDHAYEVSELIKKHFGVEE